MGRRRSLEDFYIFAYSLPFLLSLTKRVDAFVYTYRSFASVFDKLYHFFYFIVYFFMSIPGIFNPFYKKSSGNSLFRPSAPREKEKVSTFLLAFDQGR